MGRIYLNGNSFLLEARDGKVKHVFTTALRDNDLRRAIESNCIQVDEINWDMYEVLSDLEHSGYVPSYSKSGPQPQAMPGSDEFIVIDRQKGSVTWMHVATRLAKRFVTRTMEQSEGGWTDKDDQMGGYAAAGFTGKVLYSGVIQEDAMKDFSQNRQDWRQFKEVYNSAFRQNDIVFL